MLKRACVVLLARLNAFDYICSYRMYLTITIKLYSVIHVWSWITVVFTHLHITEYMYTNGEHRHVIYILGYHSGTASLV